ncbi:hypothetical protein KUV85_11630 [Nocardioides panacisoli]|uniref:hypothetical protein n=1 Tax=Nocardioides panacisoli TaxID=627624 RepID=UPI001C634CC3|nr:hypothetical protein [Nocardioides panacisoli]QYJ02984.1 hypothetical protein KUV85_11630 [Nocardioides panacisoli]
MTEPTFRELADWIDGRLDDERAATVAAYVASGDADTRDAVAWLREFKQAAGLLPLQAPPPEVGEAARDAFRQLRTPRGVDPRWFTVRFDSRLAPAAGIRTTGTAPASFHLDLEGHGLTVSVDLTRVDETHLDVDGAIRGADADASRTSRPVAVVFLAAGEELATVPVDRRGHFATRVPVEVDELRVVAGGGVIRARLTVRDGS